MDWKWKENSILNNYNEDTPCKDIFNAVCEEIAEYYIPKGWKYAKSRPKLTYNDKKIKYEIAFWSSGSNMAGDFVNLEIIPSLIDLDFKKEMQSKGIDSNGYIFGLSNLFSEKLITIPKGTKRVINILEEVKDFEENYEETGILRYNHNINVYGVTKVDFLKILEFIDSRIIVWIDWINDYEKVKELTIKSCGYGRETMKTGDFLNFIDFKFPGKRKEFEEILN